MQPLRVLLVKVPTFPYPEKSYRERFAERSRLYYAPSYALATLSAFLQTYYRGSLCLDIYDMNAAILYSDSAAGDIGEIALSKTKEKIFTSEFDVLAVSCQFIFNRQYVTDLVAWGKERNQSALVIEGGGYATVFPSKAVQMEHVDYVAIGESEHTFVHILNRVTGLEDVEFERDWAFDGYGERLKDGTFRIVPKTGFLTNLDLLPNPDWSFPGIADHLDKALDAFLTFMASRGCPMGCSFCATHLAWGKPVRYRPAAKVVDEILNNLRTYGGKICHCTDDNITFNKGWMTDFLKQCKDRLPDELELRFSNFDVRHLNSEIISGLRDIGVQNVTIATETGDPAMQKVVNKKINVNRVKETIEMVHQEGMQVHNNFIIGFPGETLGQIKKTVDLARDLRTDSIQMFPCFPYPGTRVYEEGKAMGVVDLDEDDFNSLSRRRGNKIRSDEWDGEVVKQIAYDASIEMNFLPRGCTIQRRVGAN